MMDLLSGKDEISSENDKKMLDLVKKLQLRDAMLR